ncbi:signal transduction histidine kinase [Anseongella ginsenosidimutans]|uniref:histidine kinase n=2 Tax=Anseongella ginsenosidimutans TaxID=496056 RepID=A0A4R3KS34_9SPHI|nr:HAMP domain-containing sensor histidine kinase [Anseongella ginsenosidimutans]TCS87780.1 signal transduction histidine kinase [Anseongella ginsenosidimutans]
MKLVFKFAIWYLVITLLALAIGGVISYREIKEEVDFEQSLYLKGKLDAAVRRLSRGMHPDSLARHNMEIQQLDFARPEMNFRVTDTVVMHKFLQRLEQQIKVSASYKVNGKHYYIAAYDGMVESDDITDAVIKSITGIFIVMLVVTGLLSYLISKHLLHPFHSTLRAIRAFTLRQKEPLQLAPTRTSEFKKLNLFLQHMTEKAQHDYSNLKEFTENASHEMQTPLAIIRGKLELLMESEINDSQAKLIMSAHNAVEKLSKMGQSLILLAKLENQEFETPGKIDFSRILSDNLLAFEELIEMKSITLKQDIAENVELSIHPVLADILLSNLMSNAIRHNYMEGRITVTLTKKELIVENTGDPLKVAPAEIFKRFKKSTQADDSVGLGLAIVKQICTQNNMLISYSYSGSEHQFRLQF